MTQLLWAAEKITVDEERAAGGMTLVHGNAVVRIVVDPSDAEVVETAAGCLADDIALVTGKRPRVSNEMSHTASQIVAGTLGKSPMIDRLVSENQLSVDSVRGKWEVFSLQITDKARTLVVVGSTPRGTAYGLLELSRLMGVSPYVWWADVVPEKRTSLYVNGEMTVSEEPSVKYRGIFINDEDFALLPWASNGIDKERGNIGPATYVKVMELLLRLRANTLWPAMHPRTEAFWANKDNVRVAQQYDIVLGSSHCEQMLRDNEWEWRRAPYNGTNEDWNYVTNREKVQGYWEERVRESVGMDVMYTVGMRGVHDWGIQGYPTTEDKVRGLTEIITYQRSLLEKYIGDVTTVPQLFIPYKEVLDAYNAGLRLPEDVTLCWVDDNHGYMRQLPDEKEQARSGGNGLYYHLSYWGRPEDYLWLCSHSPSLISYELCKAYGQGVRNLWIVNVGDIKPAESELEFCMDLAWDISRWTPERAHDYSLQWAARTFGEDCAEAISEIKREYYRLAASAKPEHVHMVYFTDEETEQRILSYENLLRKVDDCGARIPERLQDAFFQLVEYPVKAAYCQNVKILRAAQSVAQERDGQEDRARAYAEESRKAYAEIQRLTDIYNKTIAGGKWDGMMNCAPRRRPQFYMPEVAGDSSAVKGGEVPEKRDAGAVTIEARQYVKKSDGVTTLQGVGISGAGIAVWPLDMRAYGWDEQQEAPYVEYDIPVRMGNNHIELRCLPTFPLNSKYDLRLVLSVDDKMKAETSIKTMAGSRQWNKAVVQGYCTSSMDYVSEKAGIVRLRVSMLDPGIVLSKIRCTAK